MATTPPFDNNPDRARSSAQGTATPAGQSGQRPIGAHDEFAPRRHDAADSIKAAAGSLGRQAGEAQANISGTLSQLKDRVDSLSEQARGAASATDGFVRDRPWQAIGLAAVAGLAIGLLISRRDS